jgi:hypothetical protein
MGASVAIVEGMGHLLGREPKPLGDAPSAVSRSLTVTT